MTFDEKLKYGNELISEDKYLDAFDIFCDLYYDMPSNTELLEKALFVFSRITEGYSDFEPRTANEYLFRGVARFYKGDFSGSNSDYDQAIAINPKLDVAHYYKGINFREEGKNKLAISELEAALLKNSIPTYYDEIAENYFRLGLLDASLKYHALAIETSPNDARIWFNYGCHLSKAGQHTKAVNMLRKALEIMPNYRDAKRALEYVQLNYL